MDYLEYFKEYTLKKEKDPLSFEEKVRASFECETKNLRLIFFDLETSPPYDRSFPDPSVDSIIEIGATMCAGDTPNSFNQICNPGHPVFSTSVNGITTSDVENKKTTLDALKDFFEWAAPTNENDVCLLVAHNAAIFDLKVLRAHIMKYFPDLKCDNMYVADSMYPLKKYSGAQNGKLEDIYRHVFKDVCGDYVEKHRAYDDAVDLARVVEHITEQRDVSIPSFLSGYIYPMMSKTNKSTIRYFFKVPFDDKDVAKKMGAKWDSGVKSWYAPSGDIRDSMLAKFKFIKEV